MRKVLAALTWLFVLFQIADLVTTSMGDVAYEANLAAAALWMRYGFGVLVIGKVALSALIYLTARVLYRFVPAAGIFYLCLNCAFYSLILAGNVRCLMAVRWYLEG